MEALLVPSFGSADLESQCLCCACPEYGADSPERVDHGPGDGPGVPLYKWEDVVWDGECACGVVHSRVCREVCCVELELGEFVQVGFMCVLLPTLSLLGITKSWDDKPSSG